MKDVRLSENLKTLGNNTFSGCRSLERIEIPSSVTSMGDWTFEDCRSLVDVRLSESLIRLGDFTFYQCTALNRIDIPASVTFIGRNIFSGCSILRTVVIHSDGVITFQPVQTFPPGVRFYTNSPTVTAHLITYRQQVFPKEEAPPVAGGF